MKEEGLECKVFIDGGSTAIRVPAQIRDYLKINEKSILWLTLRDGGLFFEVMKR